MTHEAATTLNALLLDHSGGLSQAMLPKMLDVVFIPNEKEPPFPLKSRHATTVT